MKSFATFALMATALAVKLNMLQDDDATPETTRVEDMTVDDFSPEELECISMAVEGGLREKGMKGDELDATREKFHTAAEEGATLGDGVEELRKMGKEADMDSDEIDETLEKMFRRAHRCAEKKEEGSGDEAALAQRDLATEDEEELKELLEATAEDLGEKKLKCMGKAIGEGLKRRGMPKEEADAVVGVLAAGAEEGKQVKEGVEYLRAVGEENGLDSEAQDDVLLEMAGEARDCAERPTETEEESVELAQEDDSLETEGSDDATATEESDGEGPKKEKREKKEKKGRKDDDVDKESDEESVEESAVELAQEDDATATEESDEEGPSDDGEEKSQKGGDKKEKKEKKGRKDDDVEEESAAGSVREE